MFQKLIKVVGLFLLVLLPLGVFSQGISAFSSVNPSNLVVCGSAQTFTLKISNSSLTDSIKSGKATVRLPVGFQYVSSSVSSSASVKESNISNLNQPVFSIPIITPKDSVKFSISVSVNCTVIAFVNGGGSLRNFVSLSYNSTEVDSGYTSYFNVGIPSLSVSKFTNQSYSGNVGDTFSRQITITNTTNAPLNSFTFYIIKGNGIAFKSAGSKTYSTSNDTIFFTYNSTDFKNIGNKDGNLDQGEKIVLTETDSVISCNNVGNNYLAGWGCNNSLCQKYTTTSNVVISSNAPDLGVSVNASQNECYVITSPNLQSITITNSGTGSANNILVDIMQAATIGSGYDNGFYSKIDVSSIKIQYGSSGSFSSITPDSTFANYAYSCLGSNPKGRFWLKIPVIKAGDQVTIEWNIYNCCITTGYLNSWGYVVSYTDQCGSSNYSTSGMGHSYDSNYQLFGNPVLNTSILTAGDTTVVYLENNATYSNLLPGTGSPYLQYQFFIWSGIKMVTSSLYMTDATGSIIWRPDSVRLVNGIYHVTFGLPPPSGFSYYNSRIVMGLVGDTSTISCGDTANMSYNVYYEPNPSCGCRPLLASGTLQFKVNCPNPDRVGLNNAKFSFYRTSYGLPDNNDDGFPDATGSLNFSKIRRDRAMYGDTITASLTGRVITDTKYPSWKYAFADMKFTSDYLTQIDINLRIVDSTNKKTYTVTNVPYSKSGANYFYYYGTDTLQWVGASVPSNYVYKKGDSVYITIRYKVTKNTEDVNYITLNDDFYLSTVSNPTTSFQHYSINKTPAYYYAVGYFFIACCSDDDNAYGCSGATFSENFYLSIGNCCSNYYGGDIFPYEYRYWASFVKIKVVIPGNFKYQSSIIYYYPTQGQGKYGVYSAYPIPSAINGDTLYFDVSNLYNPTTGYFPLSDDGYAGTFIVYCQPTSSAVSTTSTPISYYEYFDQSAFLGGGLSQAYTDVDYVNYAGPSIVLQPALPTVSTQTDTTSWMLYMTNKSTSSGVNKPWLAFQNTSGKLTVDTVLNGSILANDSNGIFHLLYLGAARTYPYPEKIKAVMKNCVRDSVKVIFGWDCLNFPDSLGSVKSLTQSFYLYADPLSPGLQVKSINPPDSLNLCDTATYTIFVSNTQSGYAPNASLEINLPPGAQIVKGSSKLRYPMKGTLQTVSDPDSLNQYLFAYKSAKLSNYLKNNGLAGNYDTTKNQYQIQFKVVSNCDYISGSNLSYSAIAYDVCGNIASTAGLQEHSLAIIGARSPYFASLSFNGQTSLSGCGGVSNLKLKFVNNGPVATDTADYLFIDFPNGIRYKSKSLVPIHNSPTDSNLTIEKLGSATRYTWKISSGIKSGDSILYSINYTSDSSLSCGTFPVAFQSATTLSLNCTSKHTYCNAKILTGISVKNFTLSKPSISIKAFSASAIPSAPSGEKLSIKATINNSGDTLKSNSKSVLKFYYDAVGNNKYASGDPLIGTDTINTLIKPNSTLAVNKTYIVPSGKACGIIALWDTVKQNCACAPVQAYFGPVPLNDAGDDTVLFSGAKAKIGTDSISGYTYSWSPATNLSNANTARPIVSITNTTTSPIIQTYILTTNRKGCTTTDSIKITVYPLLKVSMSNSQTICLGTSVKLGGSPTVSGGSGKYTYKWTPSAGLSSATIANPVANSPTSTLYKLFVLDSTGGEGSITDSVKVNVLPNPTVKAGPDVSICLNDSVQIGGTPSASGSTGPYSYAWKPTSGLSKSNIANPKTSPSSTTQYILFATDLYGCHSSDTMNVVVNPLPKLNAGSNRINCYGDSTILGGSPTASVSKGPYKYRWTPSSGLSDSLAANPKSAPTSNTNYTLKVVDSNGCSNTAMVSVGVNPKIIISAGANRRICTRTSTTIGGSPTASGGKSPYTYYWSPSTGLSSSTAANPVAQPVSTTAYTLVLTDADNCTVSGTVTVFINPSPSISAGPNDSLCKGDSVTLSATSAYAYKYGWSPGKYLNDSIVLDPGASPPITTSYILKATDSIGCTNTDTMVVYVSPKTALNPPDLRCANVLTKDTIALNWDAVALNPQFYFYTIYRKAGNGAYIPVATFHSITANSWTDNAATRADSIPYSYYITVTNHCNIVGKSSDTINSIILKTKVIGDKTVVLNWNKFSSKNNTYPVLFNSGSGYKTLTTLKGTSYINRSCNLNASYKIVVNDTGCSSNSYPSPGIQLFDKTPPDADSIISVTTNAWGQIQINFNQDDSTDTKSYSIYRGDSSGSNYSLIGKVGYVKGKASYSFFDNSVSANHTRYLYKINVSDTCGNTNNYSNPHSPILLKGSPADYADHLYWSKYIGFNVKNYSVQLLKSGTWTNLSGLLPPSDTSYLDTLIPCNTIRYYRIKVFENGGSNAISYSDSLPLTPFDTIKPLLPAITFITIPSNGKVQINWTKSVSNDVENYTIYKESGGVFKALDSVGNVSSYIDKSVNTLTSNCYEVVAVDSCARNRSRFSPSHCSMALQVTNNGCQPANYLAWNAYSGWSGVSKYEIYRSVNGGAQVLLDSTKAVTAYKDSGLNFHNSYCYTIKAYQSGGTNTSFSNSFCKSVYFVDTPQVVVVTKLNTSSTAGQVKVQWVSQKGIPHLAYYRLYYSYNKAPYKLLKDSIPLTQNSFIHNGLNTKVGDHYYYLQTMDSCGILSEISTINKTIDFTFHVGQLVHQLNWTPYLGWPVKYYIVQHAINNNPLIDEDTLPGTDTSLHKFPAPCNTRIVYRVRAVSYSGIVSYSDSMGGQAIDTIPSNAPTFENVSYISGKLVRLDFLGADSLDTYGYVIKRSENGGPFVTAGFVYYTTPHAPAVFVDTVTKQTSLSYQIIAEDSCLNLTNSQIFSTIYLDGIPENLSDSLKWTKFVGYGINRYEVMIYKNGSWQNLANANTNTDFFHDSLSCDVPRYYKIQGFGNTYNTFSDSVAVTPFDTIRPASPVINYATVLSPNSVSLNWQLSSSNKVKDYEIDYKATTTSIWRVFKTVALQTSITVTGLSTSDTAYDFRVVAIDTCAGNRSLSGVFHQTVLLKGIGGNLVSLLSWSPYEGFNVNRYVIFKWVKNKWTRIDSVNNSTTSFNDSSVICHGIYSYKILAYSTSGGFITYSDSISVQPIDTLTPPTPSIQFASVMSNGNIAVYWNKSVPSVIQYNLWYKTAHGLWKYYSPFFNTNSVTLSGLNTKDSIYSFRINVVDSCSFKVSQYSQVHTVMDISGTKGNLRNTITWTPYGGFIINKYYIYTWNNGWNLLDSVSGTTNTYLNQPQPCNTPVNYKVGALDITGKYLSFSDSIQLIPFDTIKPAPPVLYSATVLPNSTVQVNWHWDLSTRDKSFEIWRSVNNAKPVKIGTVTFDSTYIDSNVNLKTNKNAYYVIAIDSCSSLNRSTPSATDTVMRITDKTGGCKAYVQINWTPYYTLNDGGTDSFRIYKSENSGLYNLLTTVPAYQLQYADSLVNTLDHFSYKVQAFNHLQTYSSFTDSVGTYPWTDPRAKAPELVYNTVVKTSPVNGIVHLQWYSYPFAVDTFAKGYNLYRGDSIGGSLNQLYHTKDKSATAFEVNVLNTSDSDNYFYLKVFNTCALDGAVSVVNSPIKLHLQNKNLEVDLSWKPYQTYDSVKSYQIYRSVDHSYYTLYTTLSGNQLSYNDTNVYCKHLYYYRVSAFTNNNALPESFSDSAGVTVFDTLKPLPPKIYQVSTNTTSSTNGTVLINFQGSLKPSRAGYNVYYSTDGVHYVLGDSFLNTKTNTLVWQQSGLNTAAKPYSFYLTAFDSCGNASEHSDTQSVVYLTAIAKDHEDSIYWTSYKGWKNRAYVLERKTPGTHWTPLASLSAGMNNYLDHYTKCDTFYIYRIISADSLSNLTSLSNEGGTTAFDTAAPVPPVINYVSVMITNVKHGRIDINWSRSKSSDVAFYNLYRQTDPSSPWIEIGTRLSDTSFVDSILDTYRNSYSYRVDAADSCSSPNTSRSRVHTSISLVAQPGDQKIILNWNAYTGWQPAGYIIVRNGIPIGRVGGNITSFTDSLVMCPNTYFYIVTAINPNDTNLYAVSSIDSAKPYDNIPPHTPYLIRATVSQPNNTVSLEWTKSLDFDVKGYRVMRQEPQMNYFAVIDSILDPNDTVYTDIVNNISDSLCYKVEAFDHCGNSSTTSNPGCIIIVQGQSKSLANVLKWNPYQQWPGGVSYYNLYRKINDSIGYQLLYQFTNPEFIYTDTGFIADGKDYCYRIEAIENGGFQSNSWSTELCLEQQPLVWIPDAFTPEITIGINDLFGPKGLFIAKYEMDVYNRWGSRIYYTNDSKPWDGNFAGSPVGEGVYLYHIVVYGHNGVKYYFTGTVEIVN